MPDIPLEGLDAIATAAGVSQARARRDDDGPSVKDRRDDEPQ